MNFVKRKRHANRLDVTTKRLEENISGDFLHDLFIKIYYIGSDYVGGSSTTITTHILQEKITAINHSQHKCFLPINFDITNGTFKVTDCQEGILIIKAPTNAIDVFCDGVKDPGFETTFGIEISRGRVHMCHVFEAKSDLELCSIRKAFPPRCISKGYCQIENDNNIVSDLSIGHPGTIATSTKGPCFSFRRYRKTVLLESFPSEENLNTESEESGGSQHTECTLSHGAGMDSSTAADDGLEREEVEFERAVQAMKSDNVGFLLKHIDKDGMLNMADRSRNGLLHYAVKAENIKIVRLLLKRGANVNLKGPRDQTPLHLASFIGNCSIVRLLLSFGADVTAKDGMLRTPLHLCCGSKEKPELLFLLIKHGAPINDSDLMGIAPSAINVEIRKMQKWLLQSALDALADLNISECHAPFPKQDIQKSASEGSIQQASVPPQDRSSIRQNGNESHFSSQTLNKEMNNDAVSKQSCSVRSSVVEPDEKQGSSSEDTMKVEEKEKLEMRQLVGCLREDPVTETLNLLVTLSTNSECHATLIAYLCLEKHTGQLATISQYTHTSNLLQISKLLANLFNVTASRRKCVDAGLLTTVVDLLNSPQPLQSVCLSILKDLLQQDCDRDYSNTISNVQVKILLDVLGFQGVATERVNLPVRVRKDHKRCVGQFNSLRRNSLRVPKPTVAVGREAITRHSSLTSVNNLSIGGDCEYYMERSLARCVSMKMLAASSRNRKLHIELSQPHMLKFLSNCLNDAHADIVLHAAITLTNISMNVRTHFQLQVADVEERLFEVLEHANAAVKYHAARALVYMGNTELNGVCVFDLLPNDKSTVVQAEEGGRGYVRGISVETLVLKLVTDVESLYSESMENESQIIDFVVIMHQTFIHSVVLMRLLLHCFRQPSLFLLHKTHDTLRLAHYGPLPALHARLMQILTLWLEECPEDFKASLAIQTELAELIKLMNDFGGPYAPCANKLEGLLAKAVCWCRKNIYVCPKEIHHDFQYGQCYEAVRSGSLPCCGRDFVYLAALQVYIEDFKIYGRDFPQTYNTLRCINKSRLERSLGQHASSVRSKIRTSYKCLLSARLSERDCKHNYVNYCRNMPTYGCTFFKVTQCSSDRKKSTVTRAMLGVGCDRVVILDERANECKENFDSRDLISWFKFDCLALKIIFKVKSVEKTFAFHLENDVALKRLSVNLACIFSNVDHSHSVDHVSWSISRTESATRRSTQVNEKHLVDIPEHRPSRFSKAGCDGSLKLESVASNSKHHRSALSFLRFRGRCRRRSGSKQNLISEDGRSSSSKIIGVLDTAITTDQPAPIPFVDGGREAKEMTAEGGSESTETSADGGCESTETSTLSEIHQTQNTVQIKEVCNCPPDADFISNLGFFSASELLDHPEELARQITLIDHEMFCDISTNHVLHKISMGLMRTHYSTKDNSISMIADRFNRLSKWVIACIVSEPGIERRVQRFTNLVRTCKHCLELRNYNAVMAIAVAGLRSACVKRLTDTKALVPLDILNELKEIEGLIESRRNYKRYRTALSSAPSPAVPYVGIYMSDLTFICDGNPDYLRGEIVNINKRRQVYAILRSIKRFQCEKYHFQEVTEIRKYLLENEPVPDEQLFALSKQVQPAIVYDDESRRT